MDKEEKQILVENYAFDVSCFGDKVADKILRITLKQKYPSEYSEITMQQIRKNALIVRQ